MPIVATGSRQTTTVNAFWIAANVMFDLETGEMKQILLLVNRAEDATVFTLDDAQNYLAFVSRRATNIHFSIPHFEHLFNVWLPVLASLVGTAIGFYLKEKK